MRSTEPPSRESRQRLDVTRNSLRHQEEPLRYTRNRISAIPSVQEGIKIHLSDRLAKTTAMDIKKSDPLFAVTPRFPFLLPVCDRA
jgi:hypothetical protein